MVQGGHKLIKYLLFFFNFIFVITGLALIIVGALVEARARRYLNFIDNPSISTAVFVIILGVIILVFAFLGCCGAIRENHCMVMSFAVLLGILFIMELSAGIAAYVFRNKLDDLVHDGFENAFKTYNTSSDSRKGWDDVQTEFKCCGVDGQNDYLNATYESLPLSCCPPEKVSNDTCPFGDDIAYSEGCDKKVVDFFKNNVGMIGGAGIGVAFVEIMGIVFACCLARAIKKEYEVV